MKNLHLVISMLCFATGTACYVYGAVDHAMFWMAVSVSHELTYHHMK